MKKTWIILLSVLLILAIVGISAWSYVTSSYKDDGAWVYLPAGTDRNAMTDSLYHSLGEPFASKVMTLYSVLANDSVKPRGAYQVNPGDRAIDVAKRLVRRRQTPVMLTLNNLRTFDQLAERIGARMEFSPAEFTAAADSLLPAAGFRRPEFIAAFLPDSYEFYWTASPQTVIEKMLDFRNRFWNDERRAEAERLGLTPVKVSTLCSIAEEETNNPAERAKVARLYLNRVHRGMKLQADPTVKFALGDFTLRRILSRHLQTDSPYNTYRVDGLPPGPIRMVDRRTIEAFLREPDNNYLYMCAKEDFSGLHNFASDYATHQANARRYQKALNDRGIKQ